MKSVCNQYTVPRTPIIIHAPCAQPKPSCPKPPTGPGNSHIMNIPWTNIQVHV